MKYIIPIFILFISSAFSQNSDSFNKAIEFHSKGVADSAIFYYSKSIDTNPNDTLSYYNRGNVYFRMGELEKSEDDYEKVLELDSTNTEAYYGLSSIYATTEDYEKALNAISYTISKRPDYPNALTLRGQIHFKLGNKKASCADFQMAKRYGDPSAQGYINKFCGNEIKEGESLLLYWPDDENWRIADEQESGRVIIIDLLRNDETFENWTEIGTMQSIRGVSEMSPDTSMQLMYDETLKTCPDAKLTFIEKDTTSKYPWIIFKIECSEYTNRSNPESQLYYIVQGKESLYINFRALKEPSISDEKVSKWIRFFKAGKIVNK